MPSFGEYIVALSDVRSNLLESVTRTMNFDTVLIFGPQGSGKSTQGKRLAEKLGFLFWDTGAILREILKEGGPLAQKISAIERGVLLPDEVIIEVMKGRLSSITPTQGIVFDGIPRRLQQAQFLMDFFRGQKRKKPVSIFIDLPREDSYARLLHRAGVENRPDDTPEGIATRLQYYEETMSPVIEYLKQQTYFITIDGRPTIEEITQNIDRALGI